MQYKNISLVIGAMLIFIVLAQAQSSANNYVLLTFNYTNGNFTLLNKSLEQGNYPINYLGKNYTIRTMSDSQELYETSFDPSLLYTDGGNETLEGGVIILNQTIFYIMLPDNENLQKVQIVQDSQIIYEEDIHDVGATSCKL